MDDLVQAVHDDEIPVQEVDLDLSVATVNIKGYERDKKVVTVEVVASWGAYLAADREREMRETGKVVATATFKHRGQGLEFIASQCQVRYDHYD